MIRESSGEDPGQYQPALRPLNILIVDDEPSIRQVLLACIQADGHEATAVDSVADALASAHNQVFDLCLLDLRIGAEIGLDLIGPLREAEPWIRIIVMTAFPGIDSAVVAIKLGATNYMSKPLTPAQVRLACYETNTMRMLMEPAASAPGPLTDVAPAVGFETSCPEMRIALEAARAASSGDAPILIRGEPGTGKRTLARAIHSWSTRADKPLVYTGCRGPTPLRVAYDLFGVVQRGRRGALEKKAGRIHSTAQGTLVLEEVGDLPEQVQPMLLRLLQEHQYQFVGEKTVRQSKARVIATASTPIEDRIAAGNFAPELFDALGVVTIDLPPLRRRRRDVIRLAEAYARFFARRLSKPAVHFDDAAVNAIMKHSWPGNVRELKNFVERAVVLSDKDQIDLKQIPTLGLNDYAAVSIGDRVSLERVEEMHIRAVLVASPSIDAAAATLGMDTVTLWRRRKRYGIAD